MYYDREGKPISTLDWSKLLNDRAYKVVALDIVGDVRVSTVWLGLDHGWGNDGAPPVIFETMVFGGKLDEEMDRYSTLADAERGHAAMLARVHATAGSSNA